jgi:hypothetical protein
LRRGLDNIGVVVGRREGDDVDGVGGEEGLIAELGE